MWRLSPLLAHEFGSPKSPLLCWRLFKVRIMSQDHNRARLAFPILAVGAASISMLQSLLNPVLSTLQRELNTTPNAVSWVLIAFLLSASVATPILGRIGDMMGKARTLTFALCAIVVGNIISALAPTIEILILGRAVQGMGLAAFPLSYGIIRDVLPQARVPSALGTMASVIAVGGGLGAVLAGPIVDLLGWRWLFWLPTIIMAVVALLGLRFIDDVPHRETGRINWLAASLLAGWLITLLLPLSQGTQWGWTSVSVLGLFAVSALLMALWITVETQAATPLIDMRMMRLPAVWTTNLVALLLGAAMFAVWAYIPQLIQIPPSAGYGFGATIAQAGWIIFPMLVTMALSGMITGFLTRHFSFRTQLSFGAVLVAIGCAGFALLHATIIELLVLSAVFGLGLGLAYAAMINIMVQAVPAHQTGTASGMNTNIRTIGGAMGTAIMTAIVTADRQPDGFPLETGFVAGFAVFGMVSLVAVLVSRLLPPHRPNSPVPEAAAA
jgi:MFS family permease